MSKRTEFYTTQEKNLTKRFLENGYVVNPCENLEGLNSIRDHVANIASSYTKKPITEGSDHFLNNIHKFVDGNKLNDLRLTVLKELNQEAWVRPTYYSLAKEALNALVGNELAMQLRVNLSIQMPKDDSSVLPIHADAWSGDSPYEVVLWVPYVSVKNTKSMFILPREKDLKAQKSFKKMDLKSADDLFNKVKSDLTWLDIPYGNVLIFTQNQMHGNVMNEENGTRWSSNCRFKSLLSPYSDKKLGEFFEPIIIKPTTCIGYRYEFPEV